MSARAVDWALAQDTKATNKVLLIALAWVADDVGVTFKGQETIARRLGKDARWVRRYLADLAADGLITRYRRHRLDGARTTDLIVVNMPRDTVPDLSVYSGFVGAIEPGDRPPTGESSPGVPTGESSPDLPARVGRPTGESSPGGLSKHVGDQHVEEEHVARATQLTVVPATKARRPRALAGRPVTEAEHDLCDAILAAFNAAAGTSYSAQEFREKILRRIREYPELDADAHRGIIQRNLAVPWWHGTADPRVVYGSDAQFERSMACDGRSGGNARRVDKHGLTPAEQDEELARIKAMQARLGIGDANRVG